MLYAKESLVNLNIQKHLNGLSEGDTIKMYNAENTRFIFRKLERQR